MEPWEKAANAENFQNRENIKSWGFSALLFSPKVPFSVAA
jgi:hypothetical protein